MDGKVKRRNPGEEGYLINNYIQPSSRSKVCLAGSNQSSQVGLANESQSIAVHCIKSQPVTRLV